MPIPDDVATFERHLARDETFQTIREWIVDGTLRPGEKLRDADLATALGVSRMPVREALLRLEGEGLVETAAQCWTRASPLDLDQARRLYPIVWSLETLAISLLGGPLASADVAAMEAANGRVRRALAAGDGRAAARADYDLHQVVITRAGNPELTRMLDDVKLKLRRLEIAYFDGCALADRALAEHARIIEALGAGDLPRAADAVRANWEASLERFRSLVT